MEEELAEGLLKDADGLRWLDKYRASNALVLLSRLVRTLGISDLDTLERFVDGQEQMDASDQRTEAAKPGDT